MFRKQYIVLATLLVFLLLAGCTGKTEQTAAPGTSNAPSAVELKLDGAAAFYPTVAKLASEFNKNHPGVNVNVKQSNTGDGITKLIAGEIDIADASRPPKDDENKAAGSKGVDLHMIHFASDTIVPVVHPSNPVSDITVEQLKSVFFDGDITDWSQLTNGTKKGKIKVYYTDPKVTGPAAAFSRVIGGSESKTYISGANLMTGSGTKSHWNVLVSAVGSDPDAIGYAPLSLTTSEVSVIKANGVVASKKSVQDVSYPIVNKNYLITNGDPQGLAKEFINYIMSSDGIKIVEADGYFSIME